MKQILFAFVLLACSYVQAQKTIDVNKASGSGIEAGTFYAAGNSPFVSSKYVNLIEGTPYLTEHWMKGAVKNRAGQRFSGSPLRYDLVNNKLHFLAGNGTELLSNIEPTEMWLNDTVAGKTYHFLHASAIPAANPDKNEWYQLLDSGKVHLYKSYYKVFSESLPYNSSIHEQRIITREKFYLLVNNTLVNIKNTRDLPAMLTDKKGELETFLKSNDDKKEPLENRLRKAIRQYNAL